MNPWSSAAHALNAPPTAVPWMVTVTEPLPDCPSILAGWERIATQSTWGEWRSESKMRGRDVITTVVPPATEPLQDGDEYVVRIGRWLRIRCHVLESSPPGTATGEAEEMVFDAIGTALGGIIRARFRFTVFRDAGGMVTARAQEKLLSLPFLLPPKETLEGEHRHTFRHLNESFLPSRPGRAPSPLGSGGEANVGALRLKRHRLGRAASRADRGMHLSPVIVRLARRSAFRRAQGRPARRAAPSGRRACRVRPRSGG